MAQALLAVPTSDFLQKTLGAALDQGVTASATFNNTTGVQNLPGIFIVDRVDSNGTETPSKVEVIKYASTSGATVVTLTRGLAGTSDQDHAIDAVVEFVPDILWAQAVYDALTATVDASTGLLDTTKVADLNTAQTLAHKTLSAPNLVVGSDARGDLYYRGSGASLSRLALGAEGSVLMATATLPVWSQRGYQTPFIDFATGATLMHMDFSAGNKWRVSLLPNVAVSIRATNATLGYAGMLRVQYLSTASFSLGLLDAAATVSWPGGLAPTPTATLAKSDMFGFVCISTLHKFDGFIVGQNI